MFSGKSTELIRRLKRYQIARYECLIVKYSRDNRYNDGDEAIATHDKQTLAASVSATSLKPLEDKTLDYDVIGIDEGQFFPDVLEFSEAMANAGKIVVVAALDGTFQRKGFDNVLGLVPLAEHVVKLTAICMSCVGDASYTKRTSEDKEVEVIGGADKYMAVCRQCYHSKAIQGPNSPRAPMIEVGNTATASPPKKALVFGNDKENTNDVVMA